MKSDIKQPRNYHALNAIQRTSAGAMRVKEKPTNENDWDEIDWRETNECQGECSYCKCEEPEEKEGK